ncbi:hypothetical protein TNCV_4463411 [Trichonephila clavipes]|nr:hypothetical protein TNCV_4463411 [Trichonephila clavipes]
MPNSTPQMTPDMLDWKQIWGSDRPMKDSNSAEAVLTPLPCEAEYCLVKNDSWEPLQDWQYMWLQDVMDIPLGCHGAMDQY